MKGARWFSGLWAHMRPDWRVYYAALVAALLLAFLVMRRDALRNGTGSTFDLLVFAIVAALTLSPLFKEVTLGGVTLKRQIRKAVRQEVSRAQQDVLRSMAAIDLKRMPIWEAEHSSVPSDFSERKLDLLAKTVADFEARWAAAKPDEQAHYGLLLRELYWQWLEAARDHYASSIPYQDVWRHVERGFASLAGVVHKPSR